MYKAIKTFAGIKVAMKKGDIANYIEKEIAEDLLRAGYIEEIKEEVEPVIVEIEEIKEEKVVEAIEKTKDVEKPKRTTTKRNKVQK